MDDKPYEALVQIFYHVQESLCETCVKWLLERPGVVRLVPVCPLMSAIVRGFPPALLSVLMSTREGYLESDAV